MQMRADLRQEAAAFDELERLATEHEAPVTRLRILDVLVWRAAESWH